MATIQLQPILSAAQQLFPEIEKGKVVFCGDANGEDELILPDNFGHISDYFVMLSIKEAGIVEDNNRQDNWFNGFRIYHSPLPGNRGWKISARSDHTASGFGPQNAGANLNQPVYYLIVRT